MMRGTAMRVSPIPRVGQAMAYEDCGGVIDVTGVEK